MVRACQYFVRFLILLVAAGLLTRCDDHKIANLTVCGDVQKTDLEAINKAMIRNMNNFLEIKNKDNTNKYLFVARYDDIQRFEDCLSVFPRRKSASAYEYSNRMANASVPIIGVKVPAFGSGSSGSASSFSVYVSSNKDYVILYLHSLSKNKISNLLEHINNYDG